MPSVHPRSPSPANHANCKRAKVTHQSSANGLNGTNGSREKAEDDVATQFTPELFDHNHIAKLRGTYQNSTPWKYAVLESLFNDDLLKSVKDECRSELSFTEKETDIYKVNQTGDLASLSYLSSSQISLLPNLLKLRNALYSQAFRDFLRAVTGCGPLSGTKQDMSVNSYTKGCHLLNHDDVIGTRRLSYILYMPLPHYQMWQKEWGGGLEIYPVLDGKDEPEPVPTRIIPPSWNQFIFFEVQPGRSYHSVEEVVVGGEGEDSRERLSISGWFHAAQPGEAGYTLEDATRPQGKSSREQLASMSTDFRTYPELGAPPLPSIELPKEHISFLSEFMNLVYLQPRTMKALGARFVEESSLQLHSFLCTPLAESLEPGLRTVDEKDGLGPARNGKIPPHLAGVSAASLSSDTPTSPTSEDSCQWMLKGPPHTRRYCTLRPQAINGPKAAVFPRFAHSTPDAVLRMLQEELFSSPAFRAWLAIVTCLIPMSYAIEARRFRPGLDYTLATSDEKEARLDVVLGLTPTAVPRPDEDDKSSNGKAKGDDKEAAEEENGWQSGTWGGWECYMAPNDEEEDDPAVYRSGSKKQAKPADVPSVEPSTCGCSGSSAQETTQPAAAEDVPEADDQDMEEDEGEEEEEDNVLLTVQPGFNRLLLVLRDERVMRFIKYVSASADGSRWDVYGEYEVGAVEEDEEGMEGEASEGQ
ncbi:Oxoglutarate and iron-dependent oxygenase degradation C-term-domain-containing protein [Pterulicium gracile]|uniref:uS12 prolyl 3,4-dihydroxylase n=1 Tax=Pterulicium gracile TaxID=1884261 RepID=A0A5C3QYH6_9AGAR|nr:Oxoglutarate and iron-dependent oxygenase degradation C-term-domain-containing protein [Pterula gracilis]